MDYEPNSATSSRKWKPRKRKLVQGQLITRSFVLRKDGKGMQLPTKPKLKCKKKHTFKCIKCSKHCSSVRALNRHFKDSRQTLQCDKYQKIFKTQGAHELHTYTHKDGQFECVEGKMVFPFKSQLEQHKPTHVVGRPHHCPEKGCKHRFSFEHDLKKQLKAHDGEEPYCMQCDYSNPDERLLKQHMNKHLRIPKYFCKKCGKGYIHSMQLKRHKDKGC